MKVKIDDFLIPEDLKGATKDKPVKVKILSLKLIPAEELNFKSEIDRYELTIEFKGEETTWLPNKTSLRRIKAKHGEESDDWTGKEIQLYLTMQNVAGEEKDVIYAKE